MRRLLPLLALFVVLPAPAAVAKPKRATAAAVLRGGSIDGVVVAHEKPGTITARMMFTADREMFNVTIAFADRRCVRPVKLEDAREFDVTELGSADSEFLVTDTGSDSLVLPHARSLRVYENDRQRACSGLAHLHRGKHPDVTVSTVRGSDSFNAITLTRQDGDRLAYCGIASPEDPASGVPTGNRIGWSLLSRTQTELARWEVTSALGTAYIPFAGSTAAGAGATPLARRMRVTWGTSSSYVVRASRYVLRNSAYHVCSG